MSFGFSVGDFLAASQLITQITRSLREAGGSKSEYQELLRELESLSRALQHVDRLESRALSSATLDSIKCAALLCRHPLDEFLQKIQKYDTSLGLWATGGVKSAARKVEWAMRKKEEVCKLRDYLSLHVDSINMLLMSYGLEMLEAASSKADDDHLDLQKLIDSSQATVVKNSRSLAATIRGDIQAQHRIVRENNTTLMRLFGMVRGDISASLKILADTVVNVW